MNKEGVIDMLKHIIDLLLSKKYKELVEGDRLKLLSEDDIKAAIEEFNGKLTLPPAAAFTNPDIYIISDNEWAIDFDLWMDNVKSDLTLSCTIFNESGVYNYNIDNIHVL